MELNPLHFHLISKTSVNRHSGQAFLRALQWVTSTQRGKCPTIMGHTPLCALEHLAKAGSRTPWTVTRCALHRHILHQRSQHTAVPKSSTKHHSTAVSRHFHQHIGRNAAARRQHPPWWHKRPDCKRSAHFMSCHTVMRATAPNSTS